MDFWFIFPIVWLTSSVNNNKNLLTLWLIIVIYLLTSLPSVLVFDIDHLRFDLFLRFAGTFECVCVLCSSICVYFIFSVFNRFLLSLSVVRDMNRCWLFFGKFASNDEHFNPFLLISIRGFLKLPYFVAFLSGCRMHLLGVSSLLPLCIRVCS